MNNQKRPFSIGAVFILLLIGAMIGFQLGKWSNRQEERPPSTTPKREVKFCTQEVKLCPDGSYVGRTGPNCEFAPCPTVIPRNEQNTFCGGIMGIACPTGYRCQYEGNHPDAGGTCIKG